MERDAALSSVYPDPCGHRGLLDRVNVGAKQMTGHAGGGFDAQDEFGGQALGALQPLPHGGLGNAADASQFALRLSDRQRLLQGFKRGWCWGHTLGYSKYYSTVNPKTNMDRYSLGYR